MPEYYIEDETDTLGHLLQEYLLRQDDIYFCAYKRIHPLKRGVLLNIESLTETTNYDFSDIINDIKKIENKISTFQ